MINKFAQLDQDARDFGFEWSDVNMIFDQIFSELEEVKDVIKNGESTERLQEEIGDLIATVMSLCIFEGFDVEETLGKQNKKFGTRMEALKKIVNEQGLESLKGYPIEVSLKLWQEAKIVSKT